MSSYSHHLEFWGLLAPVLEECPLEGRLIHVLFHILTAEQEADIVRRLADYKLEERVVVDTMLRMAHAVLEIDGERVGFDAPTPEQEYKERVAWVGSWPMPVMLAMQQAYYRATSRPLFALAEMEEEAEDFGDALSDNGWSDESAGTSESDSGRAG